MTEHINQELENSLRCMASLDAASWSQFLPWVKFAHNSLPTFSTGMSPLQCCLGYQLWSLQPKFLYVIVKDMAKSSHPTTLDGEHISVQGKLPLFKCPPWYHISQRVKLSPRFISLFTITHVNNPYYVKMALPLLINSKFYAFIGGGIAMAHQITPQSQTKSWSPFHSHSTFHSNPSFCHLILATSSLGFNFNFITTASLTCSQTNILHQIIVCHLRCFFVCLFCILALIF